MKKRVFENYRFQTPKSWNANPVIFVKDSEHEFDDIFKHPENHVCSGFGRFSPDIV